MDSMFNQWVDGQPWWMTLLLMPVIVLAAVAVRVVRYAVLSLAVVCVLLVATAWLWTRRR